MPTEKRKISKIGNSYGVTIPQTMLKQLDMQPGEEVQLEIFEGKIHISKDRQVSLPQGISSDFFDHVQETFDAYDTTIKGLIDR